MIPDLPNLSPAALRQPSLPVVSRAAHPPRILLLYGSLRERSYSRFATLEAERLLRHFGCETRAFHANGLPLPDDAEASHPKVQELREMCLWSEGQVWTSPERHGAMTGVGTRRKQPLAPGVGWSNCSGNNRGNCVVVDSMTRIGRRITGSDVIDIGRLPMTSNDHGASAGNDQSTLGSLKEQAGEKVSQVADTLKQEAARREEGIRGSLSQQADQLASALRSAKSEIDPDSILGRMFDYAAESVGSLADSMKTADTTDIVHGVRDFARERPGAFLGICALGGFAATRFLLASAPEGGQQGASSRSGSASAGSSSSSGYTGNTRPYGTMGGSGSQARSMPGDSRFGSGQAGTAHSGASSSGAGFGTSGTSMAGTASETGFPGTSTGGSRSGTTPSNSRIGGSSAGSELGGDLSDRPTDQGTGGPSQGHASRNAPARGGNGGRHE